MTETTSVGPCEAALRQQAWLVLLLALAARLLIGGQFLLVPDEANYWQWSRHLDIGYHDHPPMIAWTIRLATALFGQTELAVRLPTILGVSLASAYLCLLAARWFSWNVARQVAMLSQSILLMNGSALIATPDGLLLPCWAGACFHAALALEQGKLRHWLLAGMWFGLGLLSKYTMLLFLPSLFFCMIASDAFRRQLLTKKPWLALLAGLALFAPVLIWNAKNGWTTFRHVLFQGGAGSTTMLTMRYVSEFLGSQAGLISPVVFLFLLAGWIQGGNSSLLHRERAKFLIWMSLPCFALFALLSLHVRIYGNWPSPAYLTALILAAALYSPAQAAAGAWLGRLWNFGTGLALFASAAVMLQLLHPVLPVPVSLDRTARETKGWDELARTVDHALQKAGRPERTFVFGLRYQFASELAFYMKGQPRTVSINRWSRPNVYDFWFDDRMLVGMDGIGVFEQKGVVRLLRQIFAKVGVAEEIKIYRTSPWFGRELVQTLYMAKCYGFKGGLRWLPKDPRDIRATGK